MHFLIVKTSAIGDIIHSFAVAEYLRAKFPHCLIDWVVEKRYLNLLTAHPLVSRIFAIDSYHWREGWYKPSIWKEILAFRRTLQTPFYDAIFDLQGNTKSALVTSWAKGSAKIGFGWTSVPEKPNLLVTTHKFDPPSPLNIQQRYLSLVQSYFQDKTFFMPQGVLLTLSEEEAQKLTDYTISSQVMNLMVAFGSKWDNKQLSYETLTGFLQKIAQAYHPYFFFVWGNEAEKKTAEKLSDLFLGRSCALGSLSFPLWQALMRRMDCVIAMDSAALHLCGTTKTPSFSVFGPSSASVYKPLGAQHSHVQGSCPYRQAFLQRCPRLRTCPTGACMKNLSAHELFSHFSLVRSIDS
jgi:heptosyltransferase-1